MPAPDAGLFAATWNYEIRCRTLATWAEEPGYDEAVELLEAALAEKRTLQASSTSKPSPTSRLDRSRMSRKPLAHRNPPRLANLQGVGVRPGQALLARRNAGRSQWPTPRDPRPAARRAQRRRRRICLCLGRSPIPLAAAEQDPVPPWRPMLPRQGERTPELSLRIPTLADRRSVESPSRWLACRLSSF